MSRFLITAAVASVAGLGIWAWPVLGQGDGAAPGGDGAPQAACCTGEGMTPHGAMQERCRTRGLAAQRSEPVELNEREQAAVDQIATSYLTLQQQLVQDKLEGAPAAFEQIAEAAKRLGKSENEALQKHAEAIQKAAAAEAQQHDTLKEARAQFKKLSAATTDLLRLAQPADSVAPALYRAGCGMAKAHWLQLSRKPLMNPYMGQRMPRCGKIDQTVKEPSEQEPEAE